MVPSPSQSATRITRMINGESTQPLSLSIGQLGTAAGSSMEAVSRSGLQAQRQVQVRGQHRGQSCTSHC